MARIELVDAATSKTFNKYSGMNMPELPHLLVEFHGSEIQCKEQSTRFGELVAEFGGSDFKWSTKPEDRNQLWQIRHDAYYSILESQPGATALVTDVCVPISKITECVNFAEKEVRKLGLRAPMVGHLGDGNFHVLLPFDPAKKEMYKKIREFNDLLIKKALELNGTITGEHGVGLHKKEYLLEEHGDNIPVMKMIKRSIDQNNIMNPGKIFDLN